MRYSPCAENRARGRHRAKETEVREAPESRPCIFFYFWSDQTENQTFWSNFYENLLSPLQTGLKSSVLRVMRNGP